MLFLSISSYFLANWIAWLKYRDRDGKILHVPREKRGEVRHVNGLGFPHYLSLAALLTSFLRGLLNKAIPHAGQEGEEGITSNPGRCRSRRDIGFVFTDAVIYTQVCACTCICMYSVCLYAYIEYIVDVAPRAGAWLPYRLYLSLRRRKKSNIKEILGGKNENDICRN